MAQELSALPDSFSAGTTVRYRKSFSDYPASSGWTLKLHLAGPGHVSKTAVPDGNDFVVTLDAADTPAGFAAGLYKWVERVSNAGGEVYQVDAGVVDVTSNLEEAPDGAEQEWLEPAIATLKVAIQNQMASGIVSYQIAGRGVTKETRAEALKTLAALESRLAHIRNPDFLTRPVLVSFTPLGFDR